MELECQLSHRQILYQLLSKAGAYIYITPPQRLRAFPFLAVVATFTLSTMPHTGSLRACYNSFKCSCCNLSEDEASSSLFPPIHPNILLRILDVLLSARVNFPPLLWCDAWLASSRAPMAYPHNNGAFPPKLGESQEHLTATLTK